MTQPGSHTKCQQHKHGTNIVGHKQYKGKKGEDNTCFNDACFLQWPKQHPEKISLSVLLKHVFSTYWIKRKATLLSDQHSPFKSYINVQIIPQ